uniref:Regulator of complement activation group 2 gene 2 n=1 Tax=Sparus aurata TaxID=8175 RepID=A0A671WH05_SPAAU
VFLDKTFCWWCLMDGKGGVSFSCAPEFSLAQDCARPAGGPNMNLKDEYILKATFSDGDQAAFECDIGYTSAGGSSSITCTAGSWSAVMLKCQRRNCGSPGEVQNGYIDHLKEDLFGDHIEITCNQGYRLVGKSRITCGAEGWMGRLPVCEGDVVQYSCQNGLTLNGSASISCSDDGKFKPDPPTCTSKYINCEAPHVEHGYANVQPPYRPNDNVTFECRGLYYMDGNATLTCEADGKWSSPPPKCKFGLNLKINLLRLNMSKKHTVMLITEYSVCAVDRSFSFWIRLAFC